MIKSDICGENESSDSIVLAFNSLKLNLDSSAAVGDVDGLHLLESEVFPFNCQMLMFCCLFVFNVQQKEEP